jgi:hypothetical protein
MKKPPKVKKPKKTDKCCSCGTKQNLEWGPDPFAIEISGCHEPVWECENCRKESAADI